MGPMHDNDVLTVLASPSCRAEKSYIFDWVLGEILGFNYRISFSPTHRAAITLALPGKQTLRIQDQFFENADQQWLNPQTLPAHNSVVDFFITPKIRTHRSVSIPTHVPNLFPSINPTDTEEDDCCLALDIDIFGALFFLVSRYEEAVDPTRDQHDRFPSGASILGQLGLLDRAVGNEYIELLWAAMISCWPGLKRKHRTFRSLPSHDIDHPSLFAGPIQRVIRNLAGTLIKQKQPMVFMNRAANWLRFKLGNCDVDPFDQIDWLMEQSELSNTKSAFFYIPEKTHPLDASVSLESPVVKQQWLRIDQRGHEIGYHPGYMTYANQAAIQSGADRIRSLLQQYGIREREIGGRQHYLRWQTPTTARNWEAAGLAYDSTLGFADRSGFRCGVCFEFPMYDVEERRPLKLRQRPLVVMDSTVTADHYMGLGLSSDAYNYIKSLKNECRTFCGDFTILWHNTELLTLQQKDFYRSILSA